MMDDWLLRGFSSSVKGGNAPKLPKQATRHQQKPDGLKLDEMAWLQFLVSVFRWMLFCHVSKKSCLGQNSVLLGGRVFFRCAGRGPITSRSNLVVAAHAVHKTERYCRL